MALHMLSGGQESCQCGVSADCSRDSAPWEMITFVERAREGSARRTCTELDVHQYSSCIITIVYLFSREAVCFLFRLRKAFYSISSSCGSFFFFFFNSEISLSELL